MDKFYDNHKVILAPLAGFSDRVFRKICIDNGAHLTYTEMISAKGLEYHSNSTYDLLLTADNESEIVVQLFGSDPNNVARQACAVEDLFGDKLSYIDINMGCPAKKIVKRNQGSALLDNPKVASSIISCCVNNLKCKVTAKIRRGFAIGNDVSVNISRMLEQSGASAITVHGRFAQEFFKGKSDWNVIKAVKNAVNIPIVGSGDIYCADDAVRMFDLTRCNAVMIGRGAIGNPWIFNEINSRICNNAYSQNYDAPSLIDKLYMAKYHAHLVNEDEVLSLASFKKHAMHYLDDFPLRRIWKERVSHCKTINEFDLLFNEILDYLKNYCERY